MKVSTALALGFWLCSASSFADGPGAHRPPERPTVAASSVHDEMKAIDAYNAGYASILRADHYDSVHAAVTSERERDEAWSHAREFYAASLESFQAAVRLDPSMHEAYTYMGYALRKLGRHQEALQAYQSALSIHPNYPHAIEYQGHALLGLNRIDEAKVNYVRLYALDRGQAHKLLRAIGAWADANADPPPEGIDVQSLQAWTRERERSHAAGDLQASW